jgi:hypothetical protein
MVRLAASNRSRPLSVPGSVGTQDLSRQRMRVAAELGYDLVAVLLGGFADVCGARCPDLAQIARS